MPAHVLVATRRHMTVSVLEARSKVRICRERTMVPAPANRNPFRFKHPSMNALNAKEATPLDPFSLGATHDIPTTW